MSFRKLWAAICLVALMAALVAAFFLVGVEENRGIFFAEIGGILALTASGLIAILKDP